MCTEEVKFELAVIATLSTISCLELSSSTSSAASDQLYFDWDSSKGKSTSSDHHLIYKRYYNLVCVLRRSNLSWLPSPHSATISCLALLSFTSSTASDQLYFVWDSSKGKSTGSDHRLVYKRYYNLVCVLRRSNLGWLPSPHSATISCLTLLSFTSSAASDQLYFVWDSSKGKSTGSDHRLVYRYYNLVCVLRRSNLSWLPSPHSATISCLTLLSFTSFAASDQLYFVWDSNIISSTNGTTTSYVY
jgi:acid phosphatase family membrane protein YuiD